MFNEFANETFKIHVMLYCTINDFTAYGNLLGCNVKGHKTCHICEEETASQRLKHGKNMIYLCH